MTKEEAIDLIINDYKNGNQSAMSDYCEKTKCGKCPFDFDDCVNEVNNTLIDRLLEAEEHQETNLEHFRGNVIVDTPNSVVYLNLKNGWKESYSHHKDVIDWVLSPYEEPPKPKYKLSKFEHDLLECYHVSIYCIKDFWILEQMQDKGYFNDIPKDVPIKDILDNCEVTDECD